jgi:hypothetical protein
MFWLSLAILASDTKFLDFYTIFFVALVSIIANAQVFFGVSKKNHFWHSRIN